MIEQTAADVEATLTASRALLGVIARSIAAALDEVTLPQFRVLVILTTTGPIRLGALADLVRANQSTFSRTVDRMVNGGWVDRTASPDSRREVMVHLTAAGRNLVDDVTARRRNELATILGKLTPSEQQSVRSAMELFAGAAGESSSRESLALGI